MKNCNGPPLRFFRRKNLKRKKNRKGGPLQHDGNFVENEGEDTLKGGGLN